MKFVVDSCSIILLAKASVLERWSELQDVVVTEAVYTEVLQGKDKMFTDALILEKLYGQKRIHFTQANQKIVKKIMEDFHMGRGEASTIAVSLTEKKVVTVTDNRQGRKAAMINNLPLVGSIEIIVNLYKTKKINYEKAVHALKILNEEGWFDAYLIEKAQEDLQHERC